MLLHAWCLLVKLKLALGETFMPISSHGPLGLESEGCTVFSNKVLPSTSAEQPKSIVIVCNILAVSYTTLTKKPKEVLVSYLLLGFLLSDLWLLEES